MNNLITGVQQVGIGVANAQEAWNWYRQSFNLDVPVFDDEATATLMQKYTGNEVHNRRAILALNMMGGGGFEVWQFKSRKPALCAFKPQIGDLGINAVKLKCRNINKTHKRLSTENPSMNIRRFSVPEIGESLWVEDPYGNQFQIVEGESWFSGRKDPVGGVCGAVIGVSDIDKSKLLYTEVLGFNRVLYDETDQFPDFSETHTCRRIGLRKSQGNVGAFSNLLGHIDIELVQVLTRKPKKIFKDRYWGDLGFIHICFDVNDMDALQNKCSEYGYTFTVDSSNSFDMGQAAGRFSYIEDNDGTLIEFVQTHKLPILKKLGWYINLQNRKQNKPLPDWMLKTMSLNRIKR